MSRHEVLRQFIQRNLPVANKTVTLGDDDDIFELGYVNSLFAMQLVLFVEREFAITVESEEMEVSNFNTVNHIVELIERKSALHA